MTAELGKVDNKKGIGLMNNDTNGSLKIKMGWDRVIVGMVIPILAAFAIMYSQLAVLQNTVDNLTMCKKEDHLKLQQSIDKNAQDIDSLQKQYSESIVAIETLLYASIAASKNPIDIDKYKQLNRR
jgi:hypothetical protein